MHRRPFAPGLFSLFVVILAVVPVVPVHAARLSDACSRAKALLRPDVPDNAASMRGLLAACAGQTILLPVGTFNFRPSSYEHGFDIAAGTKLRGVTGTNGGARTVFRILDTGTYDSLFWARNTSHVDIESIDAEGSHFESGCDRNLDYGHAIYVRSDGDSKRAVSDITITGNSFKNFNGSSWITLSAADHSPGVGNHGEVVISNNRFASDASLQGNCAHLSIAYSVAMISLHGSDDSSSGLVHNVRVIENQIEGDYVKQGIAIWSGTERVRIEENQLRNVGLGLSDATGERGQYAILIYNSAHMHLGSHPSLIVVKNNRIERPGSCGIYVASSNKILIQGNAVVDQADMDDATLPKAAIALNHADSTEVLSNELRDNYVGIAVVEGGVRVHANRIVPAANGVATKISIGSR